MSVSEEAMDFARQAARDRVTLSRRIEQLLAPSRLFARLFTDADGRLTPDAVAWFDMIGRQCFAGTSTFDADARRHAYNQGASDAFNHQLEYGRLDQAKLGHLVRQQRELDDE